MNIYKYLRSATNEQAAAAFAAGKVAVKEARKELSSPPEKSDGELLRRLRARSAKSWIQIARLVAVYGRVAFGGYRPRLPKLHPRWMLWRRPWYAGNEPGVEALWVVPTLDLKVEHYVERDDTTIYVSLSETKFESVRALRARGHREYIERLEAVGRAIEVGTIRLHCGSNDPPAGYFSARDGQEGGNIRFWSDGNYVTVSLPGALRVAGVTTAPGEAPLQALLRVCQLARFEEAALSSRPRPRPRARRLPACDRRKVA